MIAHFYDVAMPIERSELRRIIGPDRDRFERSNSTEAGTLFGVPTAPILEWADQEDERSALLIDFYPTLISSETCELRWHPEFEVIAKRYGHLASFRQALEQRIRPSSWSGSIVPLLEIYLEPLKSWHAHPVRGLALWARKMHTSLEERIAWEREPRRST